MKKILSFALVLLLGCPVVAVAAPVDSRRAQSVASAYLSNQTSASQGLKVKSVDRLNGSLYVVNFLPQGFVIVSGDDNATPVIGYSTKGGLDVSRLPESMAYMMDQAAHDVSMSAKLDKSDAAWSRIESGNTVTVSRASSDPINPLIKVNWNQSSPYNKYCPGTGASQALVGCVAVAMSQAMSVQQYPLQPMGSNVFTAPGYGQLKINFDSEKPYNWADILSGANSYDEAARLLYHAGMSVSMGYGTDGSGIPSTQVYRISNALKANFGYGNDVNYYWRDQYSGDWEQLLLNELNAGRAIVYNAIDTKGGYGHSFNIDGYDGQGKYHLNWGWGGYGNGYFMIDRLTDAQMGMNYDAGHVAVVGIGAPNSPLRTIALSELSVEEGLTVGSVVSKVLVNGDTPTSEMIVELMGEYDQNLGSYKDIPFRYENGMIVSTRELSASDGEIYVQVRISIKGQTNLRLSQGFYITVETFKTIAQRTSVSFDRITGMFTIHTKHNVSYSLKNAQGSEVLSGTLSTLPEFQFSKELLTKGSNTLEIKSDSDSKTVKIVM